MDNRVIVAGSGPAGLVCAAILAEAGHAVTVCEAETALPKNLRASTFHPPTLDMLEDIGVAQSVIDQGLMAAKLQYRDRANGLIAEFDFSAIGALTRHPFRVQCEQYRLNEAIIDRLKSYRHADVRFGSEVVDIEQDRDQAVAILADGTRIDGRFIIGADGANSAVRRACKIPFEGFTWPERFLVISTPFDFTEPFPDLCLVNYFADPEEWYFLLKVPDLWRVMFPTRAEEDDETVLSDATAQRRLNRVHARETRYDISHKTLYRVHQRVAQRYRSGNCFLAGDAAHINNPLGGMGMNGGIHDAHNLAHKLDAVLSGRADPAVLDLYEQERRPIALEYINKHTIQNKRNLETADPAEQAAFRANLHATLADSRKTFDYLRRISMIASLEKTAII